MEPSYASLSQPLQLDRLMGPAATYEQSIQRSGMLRGYISLQGEGGEDIPYGNGLQAHLHQPGEAMQR